MRALIVDDDHLICSCLQQRIDWTDIGFENPMIAHNGIEAMKIMEEEVPDLIISDVKMPILGGDELCRYVNEKYHNMPFIFISAYEDFSVAQLAIHYSVKGYLVKPLDKDKLDELAMLLVKIAQRKKTEKFVQQIVRNEYHKDLERILEEQNEEAVEEFFGRIEVLSEQQGVDVVDICKHLLSPLFEYLCRKRVESIEQLYSWEHKLMEELGSVDTKICVAYVKQLYLESVSREERRNENDLIGQIQSVIEEKFNLPELNINMIGQLFRMSPVYLGRIFNEHTGMKIGEYILQKRIANACNLLKNSDMSVKEIAKACGYQDSNYFCKVFRKTIRMSPGEYRTKFGKNGSWARRK